MDYIKFFDDKVRKKLEQDVVYVFTSDALKKAENEIKYMRENYPKVFRKDMSFEQFVVASRAFSERHAGRQDEIYGYDYKISQNFFDRKEADKYQRAKENAIIYYEELGRFLEKYSNLYLEKLDLAMGKNKRFLEAEFNKNIRDVIVENIASPELAALINDVIKGTPLPSHEQTEGYGEYGLEVIKAVKNEYKELEQNKEKIKIQNKILDVIEKDEREM